MVALGETLWTYIRVPTTFGELGPRPWDGTCVTPYNMHSSPAPRGLVPHLIAVLVKRRTGIIRRLPEKIGPRVPLFEVIDVTRIGCVHMTYD